MLSRRKRGIKEQRWEREMEREGRKGSGKESEGSHPEYGEVIQLQGDQRDLVENFLQQCELATPDQLKKHGF